MAIGRILIVREMPPRLQSSPRDRFASERVRSIAEYPALANRWQIWATVEFAFKSGAPLLSASHITYLGHPPYSKVLELDCCCALLDCWRIIGTI